MGVTSSVNVHGLSRSISADVKRAVRKSCGFGCVICGSGVIQYEHVDPEFHEATEHRAECITLLCPGCHGRVTTKMLSKAAVKRAMLAPAALSKGFVRDFFDLCEGHPFITIGGVELQRCRIPLEIFDREILRIDPPEIDGESFLLSGLFSDEAGRPTLQIEKNEWKAFSDSWDVVVRGSAIEVRNGPGNIVLRIVAVPPKGIVVERLKMKFGFVSLTASAEDLIIETPFGRQTFTQCLIDRGSVGMSLFSIKPKPSMDPRWSGAAKIVWWHAVYGTAGLMSYLGDLERFGMARS